MSKEGRSLGGWFVRKCRVVVRRFTGPWWYLYVSLAGLAAANIVVRSMEMELAMWMLVLAIFALEEAPHQ